MASLCTAHHFAGRVVEMEGRLNRAAMIEHTGRGEDIVITYRGEVMSEWEPRDGEIYQTLDESLHPN